MMAQVIEIIKKDTKPTILSLSQIESSSEAKSAIIPQTNETIDAHNEFGCVVGLSKKLPQCLHFIASALICSLQ